MVYLVNQVSLLLILNLLGDSNKSIQKTKLIFKKEAHGPHVSSDQQVHWDNLILIS